jgi:hypothetical protein
VRGSFMAQSRYQISCYKNKIMGLSAEVIVVNRETLDSSPIFVGKRYSDLVLLSDSTNKMIRPNGAYDDKRIFDTGISMKAYILFEHGESMGKVGSGRCETDMLGFPKGV